MTTEIILNAPFLIILLVSIFVGAAAGYIGSFMVLRRMALVGDVLTHVALPGMALAMLWKINPFWGGLIFLLVAVLGVWALQSKTSIPVEGLVGLFFTGALAVGILIFPDSEEVLEALFGDISKISSVQGVAAIIVSLAALVLIHFLRKKLLLTILSEDIAATSGVKVELVNLAFLLLVAVIVSLGITFVGTLLMGALVIIPPAAAKNLSHTSGQYIFGSTLLGAMAGGLGIAIAYNFNVVPGPAVVLVGIGFFVLTLLAPIFRKLK